MKNILITGMPRSGKTTLLNKIIQNIDHKVGFVTNEVRDTGERVGFEIETNTGKKSMLAHVDFKSNLRVSRYYVNTKNLGTIVSTVTEFKEKDLLYLDEIGQMELFSDKFKNLVNIYLDSQNSCIATISKIYNDKFIEKIKHRNDCMIIEINEENREEKEECIINILSNI